MGGERTDAQALILPAGADGREHVAGEEEEQEEVVQLAVVLGVKDGQQDQAGGANDGKDNGGNGEGLFAARRVGHEAAAVAQPARGQHGQVEEEADDAGAGDEERLQHVGANVGDEDDADVLVLVVVGPRVVVDDPVQEHAEQHAEPDEGRDDGQPLQQKRLAQKGTKMKKPLPRVV